MLRQGHLSAGLFARRVRVISAAFAVAAIVSLAFSTDIAISSGLAFVALVAIALAILLGWFELLLNRGEGNEIHGANHTPTAWAVTIVALALITSFSVQAWFRPGASIASGDIAPPDGIAWIDRVFEPWIWTGSNLGEQSQLLLQLPWAAFLWAVHVTGGSPDVAQRAWYTTLFVGAGLAAFGLLAALKMSPAAALIGALLYLFNPYVVSEVNINPVYLAGLGLLPAVLAIFVGAASGRLRVRWAAALVALSAPWFGYVYLNPPLVGMVLGAALVTPLAMGLIDGRHAATRGMRTLALAIPCALIASAYWVVPVVIHSPSVANDQLASLASWSWTEARATIENAFWLNTNWAWSYPDYFPYASSYDLRPLSLAKFLLPALAFVALALTPRSRTDARPYARD